MALAPIPPWESFGFPDVLNFGVQGAKLGLERAGQTLGAEEAGDRLRLGYAQLAAENARHAASLGVEQQHAAAADALRRIQEQTGLQQWQAEMEQRKAFQGGELASRSFRDALALSNAVQRNQPAPAPKVQYANVNGRLIPYLVDEKTGRGTWAPSGALTTDKVGQLTPVDRERLRQFRTELSGLTKKWSDPAMVRKAQADPNSQSAKDYISDQARIKAINDQINSLLTSRPTSLATPGGGSAADALTAPPDANADPLGILGGNAGGVSVPDEQ